MTPILSSRSSPSRPRILWVLSSMEVGGTEVFTLQMLPHLQRRADVTVLLTEGRGPLFEALQATGVPIVEEKLRGKFHRERILRAAELIRGLGPDVVHTHSFSTHYLLRIAAILAGTRAIVPHLHGMARPSFSGKLALRERRLLPCTDAVLFVSAAARTDFEQVVAPEGGLSPALKARLHVVHDALDLSDSTRCGPDAVAALRREHGIEAGSPVIGKVGRLHPVKNLELLIEIVARLRPRHPSIRCLLVGEGAPDYEAHLRERAASRGVAENILFTGFRTDIPAHFALFDVALLTSHSEGLPRMVLEAFAAGTPVVARRIPGLDEVVGDGESGFLVESGSPDAFAERVSQVLENKDLRAKLGEGAKRRASEFDLPAYMDRLMDIYRHALEEQPASLRRARGLARAKFHILKRV